MHFAPARCGPDPFPPPPPEANIPPTGNAPDNKAVDTAPYHEKSVQSRPLPQRTPLCTLHSRFTDLCILKPYTSPGVCHPRVLSPRPHFRVPVHSTSEVRSVGPNPHAALTLGYSIGNGKRKTNFWIQSLRALRHPSMQALTNIAAQLLRQNWSIMEDLFRDAAATVHHFKKRSQPCNTTNSKPNRVRMPRAPPKPPE